MNMTPRAQMCQEWFRTRLVFLLLLLSIFFPASTAFAALGPNLVSNPSLETGTTSPTGWQSVKGRSTATSFSYPVAGFADAKAAQVNVTAYKSGDHYWQPPNAQVTAGQKYQFTGYSKSTVAVPVIATYSKANGTTSYAVLGTAAGSNTWQQFSATVTIPTGVVSTRIQHVLKATGSMAVDNYAIQLVTPDTAPLPTCSLTANPTSVQAGSAATLTFTSTNATGGTINNGVGAVGTSGTKSVSPTVTTTYTGTFNGAGTTTATCAATVTVTAAPAKPVIASFVATPASITTGQSSTLSWSVTGATSINIGGLGNMTGNSIAVSPTATTAYLLTATNTAGNTTASQTVTVAATVPAPTCSLSASPTSVQAGSAATLTFTSTNATGGTINNGVGAVGTSGTKSVSPTVTTTYTGTFNGAGTTTATCAATVTVTATPAANLLQNGDFETADPNSASIPLGWSASVWDATATFTYPVAGKGGGKAVKLTTTSVNASVYGGATWTFPHVTASSHTIYLYSNDYLSDVVSNATIEFLHTDGSHSYEWVNQPAVAVGTWVHQVINITVPSTAKSFTVVHGLGSIGNLTIDNASLVAMPASPFPNGMVTLLFDDGLSSQYKNAVPMLKNAQLKATFAIITSAPPTGDPAYMSWSQILDLQTSGFEIASHTRSHAAMTEVSSSAAQQEIQGSFADLAAKGISATTFVYPYGDVNPAVEQMVKNSGYIGARGSYFGLNAPFGDRYAVYDIRVDSTTQFAKIKLFIDQAIADKRWLILELHDVLATGGDYYSTTPTMMQNIVNYIKSSGIQSVTLDQGVRQMNP
ncbi:MAG: polysaccharide deacetylase family protein [Burkholderiaceae bacterium]